MVKDAEMHAAEDQKLRELVEARNQADTMIHAVKKSLTELGDKAEAAEKKQIEAAISDLQDALKLDDVEQIRSKTTALTEHAGKLAQRVYQAAESQQAGAQSDAQSGQNTENVVDADYEEVKDTDK
jgi:molecular chaperone DnaK